jgi:hypothetical protein
MPKFAAFARQAFIESSILRESDWAKARCSYRDRLNNISDRSMLHERKEPPHPMPEANEVSFIR